MEGYENPVYTPRQKELSDKRIQIDILQKERDSLIEEMKSKNIPAGTFNHSTFAHNSATAARSPKR